MIEDKLSTMPASKTGENSRQYGDQQAVRQDQCFVIEAHAPVQAADGDQRHGGNGVCPACHARSNARHGQQLGCADEASDGATDKGRTRGPDTDTEPEVIATPPEEDIAPERGHHKGDREMNRHGMKRVASNGNGGACVLLGNPLDDRARAVFSFAHRLSLLRPSLTLLPALVVAGCSGDLSTLDPAGPSAAAIATLWWIMFSGSVVIFLATSAALAFAWAKPRHPGSNVPRILILWGGLILPSIILAALVFAAFVLGERLIGHSSSPSPLRIEAVGERWMWTFRYPEAEATSEEVLHIPAGEEIEFVVTSTDVIHSFWVPRLGG